MGEGCRQSHDSCCVLIRLGKAWKAQTVAEGISGSHSVWGLGLVPSVLLLYLRFKDVSIEGAGLSEPRSGKQLHCLVMSVRICVHACVCVCAWCEKRQLHFYCLPPLPPSSSYAQWRCRRLSVVRCYVIAYKPISQAEL